MWCLAARARTCSTDHPARCVRRAVRAAVIRPRGERPHGRRVLEVRAGGSRLPRDRRSRRHRARAPARCSPAPTRSCTRCGRSGCRPATRSRRCCRTASTRSTVYLAALQAGWYYVPINYRLSRAGDRVHPPGLRREGVRQPRALRRPRERGGRRGGHPGRGPARARQRSPASAPSTTSLDRAARRRCPRTAPTGAAMHYTSGTTGKPKGVKRALAEHRPRHERRALHVPARPVRHHAQRRQRAPVHVAELPHRGHDVRRQLAAHEAHGRVHGQVGPRRDAAADRALPVHAHAHGPDAVHPHAAAPRRRDERSTTCRR